MAWIAVGTTGCESIFHNKPERIEYPLNPIYSHWEDKETYNEIRALTTSADDYSIALPKGTIKKLIGYDLTWQDEPVELK